MTALMHLLSPPQVHHRIVLYEEDDTTLWLSCARDRVLAAVVVSGRADHGSVTLRAKKMNSSFQARLISTIAGEVYNKDVTRFFHIVMCYIPFRYAGSPIVTVGPILFKFLRDYAYIWPKVLEIFADSKGETFSVVDRLEPRSVCTVRIGNSRLSIVQSSVPGAVWYNMNLYIDQ